MPVCMSVSVGRGQEGGEMTTGAVVCRLRPLWYQGNCHPAAAASCPVRLEWWTLTVAMGQLAMPLMASYRCQFTPGKMHPSSDERERRRWQLNELKCVAGKFRPGLWHGERRLWRVNEGSLYSTMSSGPGQQSVWDWCRFFTFCVW